MLTIFEYRENVWELYLIYIISTQFNLLKMNLKIVNLKTKQIISNNV